MNGYKFCCVNGQQKIRSLWILNEELPHLSGRQSHQSLHASSVGLHRTWSPPTQCAKCTQHTTLHHAHHTRHYIICLTQCRIRYHLRYLQVCFFGRNKVCFLRAFPLDQEEQFACTDSWNSIHSFQVVKAEVYISPKINIYSRTPKMVLHENPGTPCPWIVIFVHEPKKRQIFCTL